MARPAVAGFLNQNLNFRFARNGSSSSGGANGGGGSGGGRFIPSWFHFQRRHSNHHLYPTTTADNHPAKSNGDGLLRNGKEQKRAHSSDPPRRVILKRSRSACALQLQTAAEAARRVGRRSRVRGGPANGFASFLCRGTGSPFLNSEGGVSEEELDELREAVRCVDANTLKVFKDDVIEDYRNFGYSPSDAVGFIPVYEHRDFTMAVFVLPPGTSIPLHDHPDMYVASHVLWGQLNVVSFDLVHRPKRRFPPSSPSSPSSQIQNQHHLPAPDETFLHPKHQPSKQPWTATKRSFQAFYKGDVRLLTPSKSNIHSFTASEWTAVFDVLSPPYDPQQGRDCTYLSEIRLNMSTSLKSTAPPSPSTTSSSPSSPDMFLQPIECPPEFQTARLPYKGIELRM